jgi:hypothetical protein
MRTVVQLPITPASTREPSAVHLPVVPSHEPAPEALESVPQTELSKPQRECLEALSVFHHATADLFLRKLGLSEKSERYLQKELQKLHPQEKRDRFVEILVPPKQTRYGSRPYVYTLGRRGYTYLRNNGYPLGRYRQDELHKGLPLVHRLAVNEFLLKAMLLETEVSGLTLKHFEHEKSLNATPLKVSIPGREKVVRLTSDLLLVFERAQPLDEYVFLPEITLSRLWQKDWQDKVRAYCYSLQGAFKERFGTEILTTIPVMVASATSFPRRSVTTLSPEERQERRLESLARKKRAKNLYHWTEAVLSELGLRQEADLFSFSAAPLDEVTPRELFTSAHWYVPFSDTPRPLIRLSEEAE